MHVYLCMYVCMYVHMYAAVYKAGLCLSEKGEGVHL